MLTWPDSMKNTRPSPSCPWRNICSPRAYTCDRAAISTCFNSICGTPWNSTESASEPFAAGDKGKLLDEPVLAPFHGQVVVLEDEEAAIALAHRLAERAQDAPAVADARAHDGDVFLAEAQAGLVEKAGGAFGDADRLVHVENEAVGVGRHLAHAANDVLDPIDGQYAVKAKILDPARMLGEVGAHGCGVLAPRGGRGAGVDAAQRHRGRRRAGEDMQVEIPRQALARGNAAHAVALFVEQRREEADAESPRHDGDDPAADTALRRHADLVEPTAGVVVHAAGRHHAQHPLDVLRRQRALARQRVHAAIGERCRHEGEIAAAHQDRALPKVVLQRGHGLIFDDAEVLQHPGDGAVAKAGVALGLVDRFVDVDIAPHERGRSRT